MNIFELETYVNNLLDVGRFQDYAPNGLQIEGRPDILRIATAVSASMNVVEQAIEQGVDALLVHHGYFWKGERLEIRGIKRKRLSAFIKEDLNLLAYHLPLDAHADFGNNASMAKRLGVNVSHILPWNRQQNLLWMGEYSNVVSPDEFFEKLKSIYGKQVIHVPVARKSIQKVAWCTGGAQDVMEEAIEHSIDAFVTGEFSERTYHLAKESNVHFFAVGHHASEKDGIYFLGEHLSKQFGIQHFFIDEPNPF